MYTKVIETGQPAHFEQHFQEDGFEQWFEVIAVKFEDGVSVSFSDITARKVAETDLKTFHERLRSAFNSSQSGFFIYDAVLEQDQCKDFTLVDANELGIYLMDLSKEELLDLPMSASIPGILGHSLFAQLIDVYQTGHFLDTEVCLNYDQNKPQWFHLSAVKLEKGIFLSMRDITESKEREELLLIALGNEKQLNDRLAQREEELTQSEEELLFAAP